MTALRFSLRGEPEQRLDLSALVPDRLAKLSQAEVERLPLGTIRAPVLVGDAFRVAMGDVDHIAFEGGSARLDGVGEGMASGTIVLDGDAGLRAGRQMSGGRLEVRGSAGHWAASGMRGGEIEIAGDCGDFLGGPLAGEVEGMAGGTVVVRGNAGARAGDRLRRGMVVVEGRAGELAASRLIAGTVVVCGGAGAMPGSLMRRGTVLLGGAVPMLLPTFVPVRQAEGGVFVALLARALLPLSPAAAALAKAPARHFAGDMASLGKGEILLVG
jgi:formylmethanofuran dehydrogenase subunit C